MKRARIIALLLAMCMTVCVFTACGQGKNESEASGGGKSMVDGAAADLSNATDTENGIRVPVKEIETFYIYGEDGSVSTQIFIGTGSFENNILTLVHEEQNDPDYHRAFSAEVELDGNGNVLNSISYSLDKSIKKGSASCDYDANGNPTKVIRYDADGNVTFHHEYEYDANGNQTKEIRYDTDGNVKDYFEYEFDANGNQTKRIVYDADGNITSYNETEYDAYGNITKYIAGVSPDNIWTHSSFECENECDENGNPTKEIYYNFDGSREEIRYGYEYDANGNMTKKIWYNSDGSVGFHYEWEYDAYGNKTKDIQYNSDGSVGRHDEWEYDAYGNETKWIIYNPDGSFYGNEYEYEYDEYGHPIIHNRYDENGRLEASLEIVEYATFDLTQAQADYIWIGFCSWIDGVNFFT